MTRLLLGVTTRLLSSCMLASILLCLARLVLAKWRAVVRGLGEGALLVGRGLVEEGWGAPNVLLARLVRSWRFPEEGWKEVGLLEAREEVCLLVLIFCKKIYIFWFWYRNF